MDAPKRPSRPSVHGRIYKHLGKPQDIGFAAEDSGLLRHSIDSSTCRGNGYSDPSEAQSSPPSLPKTNFRASTSSYIPSRGDEDEMRITGSRRVHYDSDDDDDDVYMTGSCSGLYHISRPTGLFLLIWSTVQSHYTRSLRIVRPHILTMTPR